MAHKHSFSVDVPCDCGLMLSEYTRKLANAAKLIDYLDNLVAALKAQAMTEYINDKERTFCWCDNPPVWSGAVHSTHCTQARAVLASIESQTKGVSPCAR